MLAQKVLLVFLLTSVVVVPLSAEKHGDQIEPDAGNWRTWVISSAKDYRVSAPPGPAATSRCVRGVQHGAPRSLSA